MKNSFDEKILEEANDWINTNQKVVLATVIQTWGSSPRQVGSRMIVNEKGDFSGSVSGGCVETAVVRECIGIIKDNKSFKKIEFKVSNESAWEVGLACGGEIAVYLEQINSIHGPIGIKLGGKSAPEIALSIIAQLVSVTYSK